MSKTSNPTNKEQRTNFLNDKRITYEREIKQFFLLDQIYQIAYILGFFDSDGSLSLTFKQEGKNANNPRNHTLNPYVSITQDTSQEIGMYLVCFFFMENSEFNLLPEISRLPRIETWEYKTKDGTITNWTELRWQGLNVVRAILNIFQNARNQFGLSLIGVKYFDELILWTIVFDYSSSKKNSNNPRKPETMALILDLKFAFHQPIRASWKDELTDASRKPWNQWEKDLKLESGASINAADVILKNIESLYLNFVTSCTENKTKLHPYYVSGLLEGDGFMGYSLNIDKAFSGNSYQPLALRISLNLSGDPYSEYLLNCVSFFFKSTAWAVNDTSGSGKRLSIAQSDLVNQSSFVVKHFTDYPLMSPKKQVRYDLFIYLEKIGYFLNKKNNNYQQFLYIIEQIYSLTGKGIKPKEPKANWIEKINRFKNQFPI